jgi:hypothetical protein
MRTAAIVALLSLPASAQSIDIKLGSLGGRVEVRESAAEEISEVDYRLVYESTPSGATVLEVVEPEGARVQALLEDEVVARDDAPMSFKARPHQWYRVVVTLRGGGTWSKKLQAKAGMKGTVRVTAFEQERPRLSRRPHGPEPMEEVDFQRLKAAIESEAFANDKLSVVKTAAAGAWLTVEQVGEVLDCFNFSDDKLQSLGVLRYRIVDRANAYQKFNFSADKDKAKKLLAAN